MPTARTRPPGHWTNSSVRALAGEHDPVRVVEDLARALVTKALDEGWSGPPYDPIFLADKLGVPVVPVDDVFDARLVPAGKSGVTIEYNPNRPAGRRRFSLAHEIADLLFPDCAESVRNRAWTDRALSDDWQLEVLCNLAAAELVMPIGSFDSLRDRQLDLRQLLDLRPELDVSAEALLQRALKLHDGQAAVFACSSVKPQERSGRYRVDYIVGSSGWSPGVRLGSVLRNSVVGQCIAIGYTARSEVEHWPNAVSDLTVQAVGIPPYPGHVVPRVVGFLEPTGPIPISSPNPVHLVGDATLPRGSGRRLIVHVVNDKARAWKGGFASALRARWPQAASDFSEWVDRDRGNLALGATRVHQVDQDIWTASVVAQSGYGPSMKPRIRYAALRTGLFDVGSWALEHSVSVHMPRIGAGQARGDWAVIGDLIRSELVARGVRVTVYDPPDQRLPEVQGSFELEVILGQ